MKEIIKEIFEGKIVVMEKTVKAQKCSGAIYLPKRYIGKKVVLVFKNGNGEDERADTSG